MRSRGGPVCPGPETGKPRGGNWILSHTAKWGVCCTAQTATTGKARKSIQLQTERVLVHGRWQHGGDKGGGCWLVQSCSHGDQASKAQGSEKTQWAFGSGSVKMATEVKSDGSGMTSKQ